MLTCKILAYRKNFTAIVWFTDNSSKHSLWAIPAVIFVTGSAQYPEVSVPLQQTLSCWQFPFFFRIPVPSSVVQHLCKFKVPVPFRYVALTLSIRYTHNAELQESITFFRVTNGKFSTAGHLAAINECVDAREWLPFRLQQSP